MVQDRNRGSRSRGTSLKNDKPLASSHRLQIETVWAELEARKAAAEEALATSRHRIRELTRGTPSPTFPRSPQRPPSSPRLRSPLEVTTLPHLLQAQQQQATDQHRARDDER